MKVCVIGAGLSGLVAADRLVEAGSEVIVLEARDRVGGRVWSQRLANGAMVERGAEYVELEQDALVATVARLGLRLAPAGTSFSDREPRGGLGISSQDLQAAVVAVRRLLAEQPARILQQSAARVLAEAPISPAAREAIAARIQITTAHPVAEVSAQALISIPFGRIEGLRVAGGNQGLALRLAERLGERVRLSRPVDAVVWSPTAGRVHSHGEAIDVDACVITAPASMVTRLHFDPPLPDWKTAALGRVTYGQAAKLFVPLRQVPPPSSVLSVPEHFWTWTAQGADGRVQPVVSAFAGSAPALDRLAVGAGPARWVERLAALRPDLDLDPAGAVISTWSDDPWVGAAYSVRTPGTSPHQDELLARPVACLHFAGEHTAGLASASMDGALRSGMRAAAAVLAKS